MGRKLRIKKVQQPVRRTIFLGNQRRNILIPKCQYIIDVEKYYRQFYCSYFSCNFFLENKPIQVPLPISNPVCLGDNCVSTDSQGVVEIAFNKFWYSKFTPHNAYRNIINYSGFYGININEIFDLWENTTEINLNISLVNTRKTTLEFLPKEYLYHEKY